MVDLLVYVCCALIALFMFVLALRAVFWLGYLLFSLWCYFLIWLFFPETWWEMHR